MSVKWTGLDQLQQRLAKASSRVQIERVAAALYQQGETVMTESKAHYVPVEFGTLRASGFVEPAVVTGTKASVVLGYGGEASDYALIQHERLDFHHPRTGGPKYLERPVYAASERITQAVGRVVDL